MSTASPPGAGEGSEREAWLRRAAAHLHEGMAVFAPPGQARPPLLAANAALAGLLARPMEALLGQGWWQILPPGEVRLFTGLLERGWRGEAQATAEIALPSGPMLRRFGVSVSAMPAAGQEPPALLALFRDVTAQREAERGALETERLRAAADLSAEVAHALTNQLTVMAGALDLIQEIDPPGLPRAPLSAALRAAGQSTALLRRLQTLARHDPPRPETLCPREFLPLLAARLHPLLPEGSRLEAEVAPGTPALFCDPRHLETALISAMMNGLEAPARMRLIARPNGEGVRLCLDGMPPRGREGGQDEALSSLLSAAVSRRFAARSGGHFLLTEESACFLLPSPGAAARQAAGSARILIATEDRRVQATLIAQAESLGYEAIALGAEAALERLERRPGEIALLMIDTELPPPLAAGSLARSALAVRPGLSLVAVGEAPSDWPEPCEARITCLPWLPGLKDFAEAIGASLGR